MRGEDERRTSRERLELQRQLREQCFPERTNLWPPTVPLEADNSIWEPGKARPYSDEDKRRVAVYLNACRDYNLSVKKIIADTTITTVRIELEKMYALTDTLNRDKSKIFYTLPDRVRRRRGFLDFVSLRNQRSEYSPPWCSQGWWLQSVPSFFHCIKPSEKFPGQISYYPNADKFVRDTTVAIRPGRYLAKYFGKETPVGLDDLVIRNWSAQFVNEVIGQTLHLTDAATKSNVEIVADQWERIYKIGPGSCMKGNESVRVYAYPGNTLRLAYFTEDNEPGSTPNARCIVRDDRMQWIRIYPDDQGPVWTDMKKKLEALGYTFGTLEGIKLAKEYGSNGVRCPYIDSGNEGTQCVSVKDDHLLVGSGEEATYTTGYLNDGMSCCDCGDEVSEGEANWVEDDGPYCSGCYEETFIYAIGHRGREMDARREDCVYCVSNDTWYVADYTDQNNVHQCTETDDWFKRDDLVEVVGERLVCEDKAIRLDVDHDGYSFAVEDECTRTTDGRTIYIDAHRPIAWWDGKTYILHADDDPAEFLPEKEENEASNSITQEEAHEQRRSA